MIRFLLRLVCLSLLGCSRDSATPVPNSNAPDTTNATQRVDRPPGRVKRREGAAVIAHDPRLEPLVGSWLEKGSDRPLTIIRNADMSVTVSHPYPYDLWDSVIDNVRFEDK